MKKFLLLILLVPFVVNSQTKRPLTVDDLWAMKRVGTFDLSPYGSTIVFTVTTYDMTANKGNTELYKKWAPGIYMQNAKTPMLIVEGANDFRVPEGQAFELFTALQRLGVESELLYFPDEYHFVTKPQNAELWWNTIFQWFENHKKE
jgi:dipeptidyl aminopeptidase/acylaminoacyl peptidase